MKQQQVAAVDVESGGRTPAVEEAPRHERPEGDMGNAARQDELGLGPVAHPDEGVDDTGGAVAEPSAVVGDDVLVRRGGGTWTVARGDTLWEIARATYGVGTYWTRIRAANPRGVSGRDVIRVGAVLTLPELDVPATTSPSVVGGTWTVEAVSAILNQGSGTEALRKIVRDRISIVRFDTAFDLWEYDDGHREEQELLGLRGNTLASESTIRIRTDLSNEQAALTLFHELNHWGRPETTTREGHLDEEVDVRYETEQFAIGANLPAARPEYRNPDGTVNRQAIHDSVYNSPHYNPTGRHRVGREYAGQVTTSGWRAP
ncbi:MAG: LysM peptidoglycan-binding domain-containing protein [Myxococcota bacterium]